MEGKKDKPFFIGQLYFLRCLEPAFYPVCCGCQPWVDFFVGRALYTQLNKAKRRLLLVVSLIGNLGMLCFFKYGGFMLENFVAPGQCFRYRLSSCKTQYYITCGYIILHLYYFVLYGRYVQKEKQTGKIHARFFPVRHLLSSPGCRAYLDSPAMTGAAVRKQSTRLPASNYWMACCCCRLVYL